MTCFAFPFHIGIGFGISQASAEQCRDMCLLAPKEAPCGAWSYVCDKVCQKLGLYVDACAIYGHPAKPGFPYAGDPNDITASGSCTGTAPPTTPSRTCTEPSEYSSVAYYRANCLMENRKQVGHFPGTKGSKTVKPPLETTVAAPAARARARARARAPARRARLCTNRFGPLPSPALQSHQQSAS